MSTAAAAPAAMEKRATCDTGLHIIVARASTEAAGTGIIGSVAESIMSQVSGSTITAVDYPATLEPYISSEDTGTAAMTKLVTDYVDACPTGKVVLMGYSQGAQVTGDTVCGTAETGNTATSALATKYQDQSENLDISSIHIY